MIDGFWTITFSGVPNFLGGGTACLTKNRIFGGDSQYFYTGLYDIKDGKITAMIQVTSFVPAPVTVFGTQEKHFNLRLEGIVGEDTIKGAAIRPENSNLRLQLTLTKRSDLP